MSTELEDLFISYNTLFQTYLTKLNDKTETQESKINTKTSLDILKREIDSKMQEVNNVMIKQEQAEVNNRSNVGENIQILKEKIIELNSKMTELNQKEEEIKNEYDFEGPYEASLTKTTSTFYKNILFVLLAMFVIGCLIYIYAFPESGKLDMFILGLAIIIVGYYLYDYIVKKNREKAN